MIAGEIDESPGVIAVGMGARGEQSRNGLGLPFHRDLNDASGAIIVRLPQLIGVGLRDSHRTAIVDGIAATITITVSAQSGAMSMLRSFGRARLNNAAALATFAALALTSLAMAFPKPAPVPYRWELNFEAGPLRLYTDPGGTGSYWYFTYTVTNRTNKDQLWAPKMVLFTDTGDILPAGKDVPTAVTNGLLELLGNEFLEDQNTVIGELLQGKENAKEGLIVWPARNLRVTEMSLFITGISGETARVKNPVTGTDITLYKTLQRDYLVPGNAQARGSEPVSLVQETWILR